MSCHRYLSGLHAKALFRRAPSPRIDVSRFFTRTSRNLKHETKTSTQEGPITIPTPTTITTNPPTNSPTTKPLHQRLGPLTRVFNAYSRSQARSPYKTQFWSTITIYFFADIGAQAFSSSPEDQPLQPRDTTPWDIARTSRAVIIGAIASIPGYQWFMFLSRNFNYSSRVLSIFAKVTINQIVFAPTFNIFYFGMQSFLSGGDASQIWQRVQDTVPRSLVSSVFVWPFFQVFNFTMVQAEMRAISSGIFAIGWQAYLSCLNRWAERKRRNAIVLEKQ